MPVRVNANVHTTQIKPVMLYGTDTCILRNIEEQMLERAEMRMLQWILGVTLRDRLRNNEIWHYMGVEDATDG